MKEQNNSIREVIVSAMERDGLTTYGLWKLVEKHMTKPTVYEYLAGRSELTTANLQHILAALRITLQTPKK